MAYTTINKHTDYFNTVTFTGTGSAGTRTGVGFTPDMFIHKNRDNNQGWGVIDVIRGNGNYLGTNTTNAQLSDVGNYGITTDGYTFPNGDAFFNGSGNNMVFWNWKAGGTGSANTDGATASTVSVNNTAGFSIVKWTGTSGNTTVGHGMNTAPTFTIAKNYGSSGMNWVVYHKAISPDYALKLNTQDAQSNSNNYWQSTAPTNSVLTFTGNTASNANGYNMIAYCFAEKTGYSKIGSYVGNGNADGTFVYTGFKPAFILYRNTSSENWEIHDTKRNPSNLSNKILYVNQNTAEATTDRIDILSNGFKPRTTNSACNTSGQTYIYIAFGQSLVGSNNVPCTAR